MSESEKTLEELVEQRTERLRAEVERAREEGRRAGLEEVCRGLARDADVASRSGDDDTADELNATHDWVRSLAAEPIPKVEAFEVPGAGVAGLLHSGMPMDAVMRAGGGLEIDAVNERPFPPGAKTERLPATSPPKGGVLETSDVLEPLPQYVVADAEALWHEDQQRSVCEHGDHPAPPGMRFCSRECKACEMSDANHEEMECAGLCARTAGGVCFEPSILEGAHKLGTNSDDVAQSLDELLHTLSSLLAVIHRDGGQYESKVGTVKAAQDAVEVWHGLISEASELRSARDKTQRMWEQAEERNAKALVAVNDMKARAERAEADNAALLVFVTGDAGVECEEGSTNCGECGPCLARKIKANPHPGTALLERVRTLESERNAAENVNAALTVHVRALKQESVAKARVLDVLDAVEREPAPVSDFPDDEQDAWDTGWQNAVRAVRESLGLDDNEETGR